MTYDGVVDVHDTAAAHKLYREVTANGRIKVSLHLAIERRYSMSQEETAAIVADPDTMDALAEAEADVVAGNLVAGWVAEGKVRLGPDGEVRPRFVAEL